MDQIVVVGAGAMGCLFAARLALAGKQVTLIDVDEARLDALSRQGISLSDTHGQHQVPIQALRADDVRGPVDLVLLFTKAMHSAAAIRSVAHLAHGQCCALTLQNGLGNAEAIAEIFTADRVLMGVTDWPADFAPPDKVDVHGTGHIWLGAHDPAGGSAAEAVTGLLNQAGLNAVHDREVRAALWEKAAFNAALNALSTIMLQPVGALDSPEGRRLALAVADETIAVAAAQDIHMDRERLIAKIDFALTQHKAHKPSMLQDRLNGRQTEIEAINGEIVRAGQRAGLATPVTAALADLVRMGDGTRQ